MQGQKGLSILSLKSKLPIFLLGAIVSTGTFWCFQRGGHDFSVFYEAWSLVVHGHGPEIYTNSPDRFLYAPGFAWVLAPLAFLPKTIALAVWNLSKAAAIYLVIQMFGKKLFEQSKLTTKPLSSEMALAIAAGGFILVARPLLIDLQYGQVNTFILAICVWAVFSFLDANKESKNPIQLSIAWFLLGVTAISKLFALPLLLLPWFHLKPKTRSRNAQISSLLGVAVAVLIPILTVGPSGALKLVFAWHEAIVAKGLPVETHNQSFIAFLHHYFTNDPTHVIALGWNWVVLGLPLLNLEKIAMLSLGWSFFFMGLLLAWVITSRNVEPIRWTAIAVGLLFMPSYLIWKPYFVLGYPVAVLLLWQFRHSKAWLIVLGFIAMNLTGFDLLGGYWAARFEAASVFLFVHFAYLTCAFLAKPDFTIKPAPEKINIRV